MNLDSDRSQEHCPEEYGVKAKSKLKNPKNPQMESEPENKHRGALSDANVTKGVTQNNEENCVTKEPQPEDDKSSDAQGRTTQNQIQNKASNSKAQAQQSPQPSKKVEIGPKQGQGQVKQGQGQVKQGQGQVKASKGRQSKAKGKRTQDQLFETARVDMKVNKFIKNIKTGVKSGMDTAVKVGQDTKIRFSVDPYPGDPGYTQWKDAMKMVARLPEGVPQEFRKKLWVTLSERYLSGKGVDWPKAERFCFNEWSNPDDDELGLQIVRDLHRTGCSLFCGEDADAEANQLMLKRVLLAYARWNKSIGYCQGFNMLAAIILEVMDKSESHALKVMIFMIEGILPECYFTNNLRGLSVDMAVFRDLLKLRLPKLSKHLDDLQKDAREGSSGTSYEPPLTNVFTMQWFLTLFSTCLPRDTVLRVWDLILLEGNEVLLRTALAIWKGLERNILEVTSADEFYSAMGQLSREMLELSNADSNRLIKDLVEMSPFPFTEVSDLREKYTFNITPWSHGIAVAKRGLKILYSDDEDNPEDEEDGDEDASAMAAVATAVTFGDISGVFKSPSRNSSGNIKGGKSVRGPSQQNVDRERLTVDISALRKQYSKLRQRQKQAQIILSSAMTRHLPTDGDATNPSSNRSNAAGTSNAAPVAMNHLLLGKKPLVGSRPRRGPPPGSVPPRSGKSSVESRKKSCSSTSSGGGSVKGGAGGGGYSVPPTIPITTNDECAATTMYACPQPEILEPSASKSEKRRNNGGNNRRPPQRRGSSKRNSASAGRRSSRDTNDNSPKVRSRSAASKSSSTTEDAGGDDDLFADDDDEDDVTENAVDIEDIPRDPEATAVTVSTVPTEDTIREEEGETAKDTPDDPLETPTSSLAVEYLNHRRQCAEVNNAKALQIIKENSEILDKILRSKAGSESIEDEEDVTEGGGDTVILLEGQQHEDQKMESTKKPANATINNNAASDEQRVVGAGVAAAAAGSNQAIKPIPFNPFPKPVMRKKTSGVGKKLGLY